MYNRNKGGIEKENKRKQTKGTVKKRENNVRMVKDTVFGFVVRRNEEGKKICHIC